MIMKTHTRIGILSLVIGVALLLSMAASGAATTNATPKKCSIAVHLENRNVTKEQLAKELRKQLDSRCKALVSEKEVQDAANNALNLISKSKDPLKGVIYINTKRFYSCTSWGKDKNFCKNH